MEGGGGGGGGGGGSEHPVPPIGSAHEDTAFIEVCTILL